MEFAEARVHKSGNQLHVTHGDDKNLYVEFFMEAVQHPYESEQAGRPIFHDVPFIRIYFAGDNTKRVVRPVDLKGSDSIPPDPQRWPQQWAAFEANKTQDHAGIPLTEWPPITKSVALTLKGMQIHTVEQLSAVPDHALTWLGAREMREKAKTWLAKADDGAEVLRLKNENDVLKADIELLKKQFAELSQKKGK